MSTVVSPTLAARAGAPRAPSSIAAFDWAASGESPKCAREHFVELRARQRRIVQVDAVHASGLALDRRPDHGRLAGAGLADEQGDAFSAGDAVLQVQERLPV